MTVGDDLLGVCRALSELNGDRLWSALLERLCSASGANMARARRGIRIRSTVVSEARWNRTGGSHLIPGANVHLVAEGLAAVEAAEVVREDRVDAFEHGVGPAGVVGGKYHVG